VIQDLVLTVAELFHNCPCEAIAVEQFKGDGLSLSYAGSEEQYC
jgi:hypothetical protein